jgi:hypothetical protein
MNEEYYAYLTQEHEDELIDRLDSNEVRDEADTTQKTLIFPVASWNSPLQLDCAMEYQMACLTYALIRAIGSNTEEFEQAIADPDFSVIRRITYRVEDTNRALNAIHFFKCLCADSQALPQKSKIEVFKILLSLLNTFGITGEQVVRTFKEELRISHVS